MKTQGKSPISEPIVIRQGSVSVTIYPTVNRIYRKDATTNERVLKSTHPQFTLTYYLGSRRVKQKFSDLSKARTEAELALVKLANGETEALKLTGGDRADYVRTMQRLREWNADADLNTCIADYLNASKRLPAGVSLKETVDFYLKRHPVGLPAKTVREVVDEMLKVKRDAAKSDIYIKDLSGRLTQFANAFNVRLSAITGTQIENYIRALGLAPRSQNNHRRLIVSLMKFAIRRGYLPKDHSEMDAVEKVEDGGGDIEIFTPEEMRKLFAIVRPEMVPYLAIAAFAGLRAAEIQRLDWSEVNLAERFIEMKASKAKTASRRLAPIPDNLAAWLAPYAKPFGPVVEFERCDKQLFFHLAPKAGVPWKRNGLRHSFISYRLAGIKDMGEVALEAGNSAQMIFKHYRKLVNEKQASDWFSIMPSKAEASTIPSEPAGNVISIAAAQ